MSRLSCWSVTFISVILDSSDLSLLRNIPNWFYKITSSRVRQILALRLFTNNHLLTYPTQLLGQFLIANFKLLLQAIDNCIALDGGENFLNYRILSQGAPGAAFF